MRPRGCQNCQARHLKCVRNTDSSKCRRCENIGIECKRDVNLRLRQVVSLTEKNRSGKKTKFRLDYDTNQPWVPIPDSVEFVASDSQSRSTRDKPCEEPESQKDRNHDQDQSLDSLGQESETESKPESQSTPPPPHPSEARGILNVNQENPPILTQVEDLTYEATQANDAFQLSSPSQQTNHTSPCSRHTVPLNGNFLSPLSPATPFSSSTHKASLYQPLSLWPFNDAKEARYFQHFVYKLSTWLDAVDPDRHFATEVPRRAAFVPVIMNAILASSSRHWSLLTQEEDTHSHIYHDKCLQILIPVLDDPLESLDDSLFAAVIILRQYEEYDDNDERCHLIGSTRLFNSGARAAPLTNLREAASWVALRQEIYVSLTTKQPHSISLDNYQDSPIFHSDTTNAWANSMVYLFARVLNFAFGPPVDNPFDVWCQLDDDVETWNNQKPQHFSPIWVDHDRYEPYSFPKIMMFGSVEVVGMQHYCLARILLAVYDPRLSKLGFETHKLRKDSEATVVENMKKVVGMALGNDHIGAAFMHASHILSACGHYLSKSRERQQAIEFLRDMERDGTWRTSGIIARLREQWT